jgi:AcrR family transcriptional regulator
MAQDRRTKSRKARKGTAPAARRKRRSPGELNARILKAAAAEFRRAGYIGATTAAIAQKADVTEAQLFRYFGSKSNLFREAIFRPLDEQLLQFTRTHVPDEGKRGDFAKMSALYIEGLQRFARDNASLITSLVIAQTYQSEPAHGIEAIGSLSDYFDRGATTLRGYAKGKPKVDPKLMVRVSFVAVLACIMFKDWIFPARLASDRQIGNAIRDFVLEGLNATLGGGHG